MVSLRTLLHSKAAIAIAAVVVIAAGSFFYFSRGSADYQLVTVERGSLVQTVSLTGNTTPVDDVSLGFQTTGTVARVYRALGENVRAGELVAELNTAALSAALEQAKGQLAEALATRSSTSLPEADAKARAAYVSAYTTLDTELHNDVDTFFGSPTSYGPMLLITNPPIYDYGELSSGRDALSDMMDDYQKTLTGASTSDPLALLAYATGVTQSVSVFLDKLAVAANDQDSGASAAQVSALATARTEVAALLSTLSAARDTYRSESVGATSLSDAQLQQARAAVAAAQANLANARLVAPISGVITKQDAKVGQLASAGTPLVTIISGAGFEVDSDVSETDVGKISTGDPVAMTIDAFPNETFAGSVFYIAPAETNTEGVVSYEVKIAFANPDPRLKSGLTANIDIETDRKDDVLILPQYAILENDEGAYVQTIEGGKPVNHPVTLGIQDQEGNVEVLSGVAEGEQVANIGLKTQ